MRPGHEPLAPHGRALNVAIYDLMEHLWFSLGLRGGTGGLTSSAIHEYVEEGGARRHVWIRVSYIHMRARSTTTGAVPAHDPTGGAPPGGAAVGELGGTGNATTGGGEHVHQAIGIYLHPPAPPTSRATTSNPTTSTACSAAATPAPAPPHRHDWTR